MKTINVIIADPYVLIREGLKKIFASEDHIRIVAEASDKAGLKSALQKQQADLIIMDYQQEHFPLSLIANIRVLFPKVRILIISSVQTKKDILQVLDTGISGYLLKECDIEEIIEAVNAISMGKQFFCGRLMEGIIQNDHSGSGDCAPLALSQREVQIVRLIAEGLRTRDIAQKLFLSYFTVATHRKNIFRKLQIRNSPELILYAMNEGII